MKNRLDSGEYPSHTNQSKLKTRFFIALLCRLLNLLSEATGVPHTARIWKLGSLLPKTSQRFLHSTSAHTAVCFQ